MEEFHPNKVGKYNTDIKNEYQLVVFWKGQEEI